MMANKSPTKRGGWPPYGWWQDRQATFTTIRGWDWAMGALSLVHGAVTLPLVMYLSDSSFAGLAMWMLLSIVIGAGVGWRIKVTAQGMRLHHTWFGLPVPFYSAEFPSGTSFGVVDEPYAPADMSESVWIGSPDECTLGNGYNASQIFEALEEATHHHWSQ